ncbi:MAG: alanine--tRNA ligase, partial [Muribaculaceae bacterium]|nr:alanine--tRNA ligase [Muribaculaceae bacterium]
SIAFRLFSLPEGHSRGTPQGGTLVNARIRKAMPLEEAREMPIEEARKMGAMALFGEKYGDKVRVVKYGSSVELCGGTHVANSGNIGMLRIVSESSIAAGIRRIEAVTASGVENMLDDVQDTMRDLSTFLGNASNVKVAVEKAIKENSDLRKQVEDYMEERVKHLAAEVLSSSRIINGVKVAMLSGQRLPEVVKNVAFTIKKSSPENTVFIGATLSADKPLLTLMISDDLVKNGQNASKIVREAAKLIKGGGGGQPFFAQAGGKDANGLSAAADKILELLNL